MKRLFLVPLLALTAGAMPVVAQATVTPSAAPDAARSDAAKITVDAVFPVGTYRKLMGGSISRMMSTVTDRMLDMPVRDMMQMGGAAPDELKSMSGATMRQVMEIVDPAFAERNRRMFAHMMTGMGEVMNGFEPEVRSALTDAYAARFTLTQLQELNRFFATPTGHLYAENAMTLAMDPAFMDRMTKLMPRLMQAMPAIMKSAMADTKDLAPRRSYAELSEGDRTKLSQMLGVSAPEAAKVVAQIEKQQKNHESRAE